MCQTTYCNVLKHELKSVHELIPNIFPNTCVNACMMSLSCWFVDLGAVLLCSIWTYYRLFKNTTVSNWGFMHELNSASTVTHYDWVYFYARTKLFTCIKKQSFSQSFQFSVIICISCSLHVHNRSQSFQLATLLMITVYTQAIYSLWQFNCSHHLNSAVWCFSVPPPRRLRHPELGADLSGAPPDDVLHEYGQPVSDRAAAP